MSKIVIPAPSNSLCKPQFAIVLLAAKMIITDKSKYFEEILG